MIGRYRCVALDGHDYMISGRKGWIFVAGPGRLGVVLVYPGCNEKIFYCDYSELDKWVTRIDVSCKPTKAVYYANNPNARHD